MGIVMDTATGMLMEKTMYRIKRKKLNRTIMDTVMGIVMGKAMERVMEVVVSTDWIA